MTRSSPWEMHAQAIPSGLCVHLFERGNPLAFRDVFHHLEHEPGFRTWYGSALRECGPEAFFWEHPPLTPEAMEDACEFVLIETGGFEHRAPQPEAFAEHFACAGPEPILRFPNLGGDAVLVVPRPIASLDAYAHLGAFLRLAPEEQISALLRAAAIALREQLSDSHLSASPVWLSTSGLGVTWLHLRLDTTPKYYSYAPYRTPP